MGTYTTFQVSVFKWLMGHLLPTLSSARITTGGGKLTVDEEWHSSQSSHFLTTMLSSGRSKH
jgi:hypothetical protein